MHALDAARTAGLRALAALQAADGSFALESWNGPARLVDRALARMGRRLGWARQTPTGPTFSYDPLFATAYILMSAGRWLPRTAVDRAVAYLERRRDADGLWTYGQLGGEPLPPDSDCTACALAAMALAGVSLDADAEAGRLRRFWRPDLRRFRTWDVGGAWSIPERDDPVVNANIVAALAALKRPATAAEQAGVAAYLAACAQGSRYYCAPATIAHAAHRAGLDPTGLAPRVRARPGRGDLIGTIQWLCAGHAGDPEATRRVLAAQRPDGSWPALAWVRAVGLPTSYWGSAAVTTALAIEALGPPDGTEPVVVDRSPDHPPEPGTIPRVASG